MRAKLASNCSLFDVPEDLTYFVRDDDYLVLNPKIGGRCLLSRAEFDVLATLARAQISGQPARLPQTPETERALAKLILNWVAYYNGATSNNTSILHGGLTRRAPGFCPIWREPVA